MSPGHYCRACLGQPNGPELRHDRSWDRRSVSPPLPLSGESASCSASWQRGLPPPCGHGLTANPRPENNIMLPSPRGRLLALAVAASLAGITAAITPAKAQTVMTTPDGLEIIDLKVGTGAAPKT